MFVVGGIVSWLFEFVVSGVFLVVDGGLVVVLGAVTAGAPPLALIYWKQYIMKTNTAKSFIF